MGPYATKETFVLEVIAMGMALDRFAWDRWGSAAVRLTQWLHAGIEALAAFLGVAWESPDCCSLLPHERAGPRLHSHLPSLGHRAQGHSPHIHPVLYLERLGFFRWSGPFWTEGLILVLAGVGCYAGFAGPDRRSPRIGRFLGFNGCSRRLQRDFTRHHGLSAFARDDLVGGVGAAFLLQPSRALPRRAVTWVVLLAAGSHLAWEAWRANFGVDRQERLYAADRRNPYVYAQTVPDILELVEKVTGLATAAPEGKLLKVHVIAPGCDYWPLPWYLRRLRNVRWLDEAPADPFAPVVVGASTMGLALDEKSNRAWTSVGLFTLRPRVYLDLFVESRQWRTYVESKTSARK